MVHLSEFGEINYLVFWFLLDLAECRSLKNSGTLWKQHSPYYVLKKVTSVKEKEHVSLCHLNELLEFSLCITNWNPVVSWVSIVYFQRLIEGPINGTIQSKKKKKKKIELKKVPVHLSVSKTNKYFRNSCQTWKCLKTCMFIKLWIIFILDEIC